MNWNPLDALKRRESGMKAKIAAETGIGGGGGMKPSFDNVRGGMRSTELPATYTQSQALKRRGRQVKT